MLGTVLGGVVIYAVVKFLRYKQISPRFIPTRFLKEKWRRWLARGHSKGEYRRASRGSDAVSTVPSTSNEGQVAVAEELTELDRHTSVRSVATLPAYKPTPRETERILGREGERAGIDVVVEFPETAEEEETRRDEDMEALYQVRVARTRQLQDREDRRRRRREARERGDTAALEALRMESRARARERAESAASQSTSRPGTNMTAHNSTLNLPATALSVENASRPERERRISSVSYAAVGLARHDGTRVRASSDSEQRPLLDAAAPMNVAPSRSASPLSQTHSHLHHGRRDSSTHSVSSAGSGASSDHRRGSGASESTLEPPTPPPALVIPRSRPPLQQITNRPGPVEPPEPPSYDVVGVAVEQEEEAPPYESPVSGRPPPMAHVDEVVVDGAPRLPEVRPLPAIEITADTPVSSNPGSPVRRLAPLR